ncbi:nucleotide exchange factor GrpE [Aliinostoc sp. HNIBRCY26]|uniref:nucleotide exchange factor GrpE n=1 Tax=Aliinostoc sp. HNIBRCY26 TaxID=3418997 RepID=UPI003D07A62E
MFNCDRTPELQDLMQRVGISSFKALSRAAGVSERQILRLRQGALEQMRLDVLLKLSQVLQISLNEFVATFLIPVPNPQSPVPSPQSPVPNPQSPIPNPQSPIPSPQSPIPSPQELTDLRKEYERSQLQLEQQREVLLQEFQQSSLQLLESLLLQWPTAAQKAQENPQLAAVKILPLVQKPLEKLLQAWGIEAIAPVGAELPYNPQLHQLSKGTAQPGEIVKIRYTGYIQGEKLLYRAEVSPV